MPGRVTTKTLIVTGAGRGLGAAIARLAATRGWSVAVNYANSQDAAEALAAEIVAGGGAAAAIRADIRDAGQVASLFDAAEAALGPVTGLVNNAGTARAIGPLADAEPAAIDAAMALNVMGTLHGCREAARRMSSARGGTGGAVVNISSGAATIGSAGEFVDYAAAKAAVDTLTQGLGAELAREGVRVNAVAVGLIDTDFHATIGDPDRAARMADRIPIGRAARLEEIAEPVLWLLSDAASYVTGAVLRVAGGR